MSNKADLWLGTNAPNAQPGNVELRGNDTARLISARPSTVVFMRKPEGSTATISLPPQTVRLEVIQGIRQANEVRDALIAISKQYCVLIGFKGTPGIPDTDLQRADLFFFANLLWEVIDFLPTIPGRLMASAQVTP